MSYLAMYRGTRNPNYLAEFIFYADEVISQRDDFRNVFDKTPTWSQKNYTENIPYPTLVGEGMISFPIADFAALVLSEDMLDLSLLDYKKDGSLIPLTEIAWRYFALINQTVQFHDIEFKDSVGGYYALPETGTYFLTSDSMPVADYAELPFNMSMAMGRTLVALNRIKKNESQLNKISLMIQRWKDSRRIDSQNLISWPYWYSLPTTPEDVSHGAIDVDFLRLAYEFKLTDLLTYEDMKQLAHVFSKKMYYKEGLVCNAVNGTTCDTKYSNYFDTASWMNLSSYDKEVKFISLDASRLMGTPTHSYHRWGLAMLDQMGGRNLLGQSCRSDRECESNICLPKKLDKESSDTKIELVCSLHSEADQVCRSNQDCVQSECQIDSKTVYFVDRLSHWSEIKLNPIYYGVCNK